jgi:ATPase subunit of ABC transporter with duplicated ATPase domains
MISISNLGMQYGPKILFQQASLNFDPGKRYGLVGANGAGKSTLLRILTGEENASDGKVAVPRETKLGILKQDHFSYEETVILHVVLQGRTRLWEAFEQKERLLSQSTMDEETGHQLAHLEEVIAEEDGYTAEAFAAELLAGLGIAEPYHQEKMRSLSGGFKLRVLLAQVLFSQPDVLLLDEPTNHLDIVSIRWLEDFLINTYQGTLIFVSHDRDFLNSVSTHIVDIDYQEVRPYVGNYDKFLDAKDLASEQRQKEIDSVEKKAAEMQAFVDRFRAKATKARQAQSRVRMIEKMDIPEAKRSTRVAPNLRFLQTRPSGKTVLTLKNVHKSFGDVRVLKGVSTEIQRGEKVALIGPNGVGKSTLLKIALGNLHAEQGETEWGYEAQVSYFAQDHHDLLTGKVSVYDWLYSFAPQESIGTIRGLLGQVLFSGDSVKKSVNALSGGEAARLLFAKIMLEKRNVLVLDEPTNHLDLEGVDALADALAEFEGTVIVVSHDRHFVARVATHILELTPDGARDFSGSYKDYLERFGDDYLNRDMTHLHEAKPSQTQPAQAQAVQKPKLSGAERKEQRKQISQLQKKVDKLEQEIAAHETQIEQIEQRFSSENFYRDTQNEEIQRLEAQKTDLQQRLAQHLQRWEEASSALEELRQTA